MRAYKCMCVCVWGFLVTDMVFRDLLFSWFEMLCKALVVKTEFKLY